MENTDTDADTLLSVSEAVDILRAHPNSVRQWADQELLPACKIGRPRRSGGTSSKTSPISWSHGGKTNYRSLIESGLARSCLSTHILLEVRKIGTPRPKHIMRPPRRLRHQVSSIPLPLFTNFNIRLAYAICVEKAVAEVWLWCGFGMRGCNP